jgi:hypothetical protein
MLSGKTLVFGVPLLVAAGFAAQGIFGSKFTGNMVEAHFNDGPFASVDIMPADSADGRAYFVSWRSCTLNPDFEHRVCVFASGLAPRSAIKTQQVATTGINLDISMLSVVFTAGGENCMTGVCMPFTPPSVPLNGTFTVQGGQGGWVEQSTGSTRRDDFGPGGMSYSQSFHGNRTRYSANFAGTVGMLTIVPPPFGSNGFVSVMKGQQTFQTVYPAMP